MSPEQPDSLIGMVHLHGGPLAGMWGYEDEIPQPSKDGQYMCDEGSAGGRDWDWEPS